MTQIKVLLALSLLTASLLAQADTTYYVAAKDGLDSNPGTPDLPFRTIQAAANIVAPGDKVIVRDGLYETDGEVLAYLKRSGTAEKPILFRAENAFNARLSGRSGQTTYGWFIDPGVSHVIIKDFDLRGFRKTGLFVEHAHYIFILGNNVQDIGRICTDSNNGIAGVYARASDHLVIAFNQFSHLGRLMQGEEGCQVKTEYYKNHDHGIYLDGVSIVAIRGNTFSNIKAGWGIQFYSGDKVKSNGLDISYNTFYQANPFRDGHIVLAEPGVLNARINRNLFYQPRNQAIYFDGQATYSSVTLKGNTALGGTVITTPKLPPGVKLLSNTVIDY
jgi:hypothetical protein